MANDKKPLFKVTDTNETLIKPMDADYEVLYTYQGEAPVKVTEGEVKRGQAELDKEFPGKAPDKVLEKVDIKVIPKNPVGWNAYAQRTKVMTEQAKPGEDAKLPEKGETVELSKINATKPTKKELREITDQVITDKKAALTN